MKTRPWPAALLRGQQGRQDALEQERLAGEGVRRPFFEAGQHQEVLDQSIEALGLGLDVLDQLGARRSGQVLTPRQDLRAGQDRRHRRPELVREDAHERLARPSRLARGRDIANEEDRAARGRVGRADDREGAQLEPAPGRLRSISFDRPLSDDGAQLRRPIVGIVEDRQQVGVGPDPRVRQDLVGGGIREGHVAVDVAHDDGVTDRRQGRLELGRPGTLLLDEALQLGLRLDALGGIADDCQELRLAVVTIEWLQQQVDGAQVPIAGAQDGRDGRRPRHRRSGAGRGTRASGPRSSSGTRSSSVRPVRASRDQPLCRAAPSFA